MDTLTNAAMEAAVRGYFDACNSGDAGRIAAWFTADAVHYFPEGSPFGALRGARAIGENWAECVRRFGSWWTVDRFLGDALRREAVIEWTHFKTAAGRDAFLRGDEWYCFDAAGLITEIRAYYACPAGGAGERFELGGYDYPGRGYPLRAPAEPAR